MIVVINENCVIYGHILGGEKLRESSWRVDMWLLMLYWTYLNPLN